MKIIDSKAKIDKWQVTAEDEFVPECKGAETIGVELLKHPKFKLIFHITWYADFTCPDTNFLLDVIVKSVSQLEYNNQKITAKELYDVYIEARVKFIGLVIERAIQNGYLIQANQLHPLPFEDVKIALDKEIYNLEE